MGVRPGDWEAGRSIGGGAGAVRKGGKYTRDGGWGRRCDSNGLNVGLLLEAAEPRVRRPTSALPKSTARWTRACIREGRDAAAAGETRPLCLAAAAMWRNPFRTALPSLPKVSMATVRTSEP